MRPLLARRDKYSDYFPKCCATGRFFARHKDNDLSPDGKLSFNVNLRVGDLHCKCTNRLKHEKNHVKQQNFSTDCRIYGKHVLCLQKPTSGPGCQKILRTWNKMN